MTDTAPVAATLPMAAAPAPTAEASAENALQAAVHDAYDRGLADGAAKEQAAAAAATAGGKANFAAIIAAWVNTSVNNTPIAQNTEGYSHLTTVALPDLLKRLAAA